jgi:hypothetical protein
LTLPWLQDSNDAVAVIDDRHPPHLMAAHRTHAVLDRIIDVASMRAIAHAVFDAGSKDVSAASHQSDHDVAIGNHPD